MRIDLTCPVEVWSAHIPTADNPFCTLQMYNLSRKDVSSLQVAILGYDGDGEQISRHAERVLTPEAKAQHVFELSVRDEDDVYVSDLRIMVEKVWFEDDSVWRRGVSEMTEYKREKPLEGEQLEVMQALAGPDATCLPADQGNVWICVCSRVNAPEADACVRCGRDKHDVFLKLNKAELEKVILRRRGEQEEKERAEREKERQAEEEKAELRRKKKRRGRIIRNTVISFAALAVAFVLVWFFGIPYYRYLRASQALENGQFSSAREQFVALGDYSDSAEMVLECDYRGAMSGLKYGTYTSLTSAQETFEALGDYKDSAERAREAAYTKGEKYFAAGRWEEAVETYEQVSGYSDASGKRVQALYAWAGEMFKAGDYAAAREKYLLIPTYMDSSSMARECLYQPALKLLESEPAKALEAFSDPELDGYMDVDLRRLEACYLVGEEYFTAGDYDTAAEYYSRAGDFRNARTMLKQCLYDPAMEDMARGDYLAAAEKLEQILTFDDARAQWETCVMNLGQQAMAAEDYEGAMDWFNLIASDNVLASTLLNECIYREAMRAYDDGDLDRAERLFSEVPGFQDSDNFRYEILYARARGFMENEAYGEAEPILAELGTYENSDKDLRLARYRLGMIAMEEERYGDAVILFDQIGDYEDAPDQLDHARYLMALDLKNSGEWQRAADIFRVIRIYADSDDQYMECLYEMASEALAAGDKARAAECLAEIPGYRDADELYPATVYSLAVETRARGDYALAADWFARIPDHEDSAAQAQECEDMYYSQAYDEAVEAYRNKDYPLVVSILEGMDLTGLPERYKSLDHIFSESAYQAAEKLYKASRPYEALRYYRLIPDYKDVSKKLNRTCYAILGLWTTEKDGSIEFRDDGTCTVFGKERYYYATQYAIYMGEEDDPEKMAYAYNIFSRSGTSMKLKDMKTNTYYQFTRAGEDEQ